MENETPGAVKLSETDRAILDSYKHFCDGLSDYLGDGYEIVLHDLSNFDRSVIKIINGYYTGRREGSPITDLALHMLEKINDSEHKGHISYFSKNKTGEPLHSCTITIRGEKGRIIGLMCINFYLNTSLYSFFSNNMGKMIFEPDSGDESYVSTPEDLITETVSKVKSEVMSDVTITTQNKNKEIVCRLADRGIFKLKNSVSTCAELLGLSRHTVYLHLRNHNT